MARTVAALATGTLALAAFAAAPAKAQPPPETVGVAAAVHPQTSGTLPGGAGQVLRIGNDVFRDQRIRTSTNGRAHLLFLDETRLSLAPNSQVVLNWYRYDGRTRTAELNATVEPGSTVRASTSTGGGGAPSADPGGAGPAPARTAPQGAGQAPDRVPGAPASGGAVPGGGGRVPTVGAGGFPDPPRGGQTQIDTTTGSKRVNLGNTGNSVELGNRATAAIAVDPNGDTTVMSFGDGPVAVRNARGEFRQIRRNGFGLKVSAGGVFSAFFRVRHAEVGSVLRLLEGQSGTGQRADERTLNAINRQNAALSPAQMSVQQLDAMRAIDPRYIDGLAGTLPWRLNDVGQSDFLRTLEPPTDRTPPTTPGEPGIRRAATPPAPPAPPVPPPSPTIPTRPTIPTVPTTGPASVPVGALPPTPPPLPVFQPPPPAFGIVPPG